MRELLGLSLLICLCTHAHGVPNHTLELFIKDIIVTWKLISPTIIVDGDFPEVCRSQHWVLCLESDTDNEELVDNLEVLHRDRKQDGIIFAGLGQKELLQQLNNSIPTIFASNCPVFMPTRYSRSINLRLDSNVIFFEEKVLAKYALVDIFAVKGGSPILLSLANWTTLNGILDTRKTLWT